MSTDAEPKPDSSALSGARKGGHGKRLLKWGGGTLAVLSGLLWGLYEYQPMRYDFVERTLPADNAWADPDSAHLFSPGANIVIVTAHPDDAEFYLGGLLTKLGASGAKLTLIVCTDGDKGYYLWEDAARNRRVRQQEQRDAAKMWNAQEVIFFSYPDGRLFANPDVVDRIATILKRVQPDYILAFDYDYSKRLNHRDHRNAGDAAEKAVHQAGTGRWLLRFNTLAPNFAVDVTSEWPRKRELLAVHASQFNGKRLAQVENIVTRSAENDGRLLRVRYAEGLRCTRLR